MLPPDQQFISECVVISERNFSSMFYLEISWMYLSDSESLFKAESKVEYCEQFLIN